MIWNSVVDSVKSIGSGLAQAKLRHWYLKLCFNDLECNCQCYV